MKIAFIGIGRLGGALALSLAEQKYEIGEFISANPENAAAVADSISPKPRILSPDRMDEISADAVFITVPDSLIRPTAEKLAGNLRHRPLVLHASGALASNVLGNLRSLGCTVGSLHPLVSVSAPVRGAGNFKNAYFCIEGDAAATDFAEKAVAALGGKSFSIDSRFKPLYHAAAVTSAGHLTALFSAATEMLAACGLPESDARRILLPLAESALKNLASQTPAQALTGTFARADAETLKAHLEIIGASVSPEILDIYRALGFRSLDLAAEQGAPADRLARMREILGAADS